MEDNYIARTVISTDDKLPYGKKVIHDYLTKNSIEFFYDKCLSGIQFDFLIPTYCGGFLAVEFWSLMHFKEERNASSRSKGLDALVSIRMQDQRKERYCLDHNIPLCIISYNDLNIERELDAFLRPYL